MKITNKVKASFTVEAALILPLIIFVILGVVHIAIGLHNEVITLAQQKALVTEIDPVETLYRMNGMFIE